MYLYHQRCIKFSWRYISCAYPTTDTQKLERFKTAYPKAKAIIEQNSDKDNGAMRFLKHVANFLSCGIAKFRFGLWSVTGAEGAQKMEEVDKFLINKGPNNI